MATNCGQYKSELDLLHEIADSLSGGGSSGGKDFELQVVKDANGDLFLFRPKLDEGTDTYTFDYIDAQNNVVTPVQPVEVIGSDSSFNVEFINVCMTDDTLNDGTALVSYEDIYLVKYDGTSVTSTYLGSFADSTLQTPYTPIGTTYKCADYGDKPETAISVQDVTNGTFSPDLLAQQVTIRVITGNNSTFTDSNSNTVTLEEGEVLTWFLASDTMDVTPVLTVPLGEVVRVTYTFIQ